MRNIRNVKSSGSVFARQTEIFEPEMAAFRSLPKVTHVWCRRNLSGEDFRLAVEMVRKETGAIPVFHPQHREVCLDFCLPGVLGERISS